MIEFIPVSSRMENYRHISIKRNATAIEINMAFLYLEYNNNMYCMASGL